MVKIMLYFIYLLIFVFPFVQCLCPEGSFEWQNKCLFFQGNQTGFADAESKCMELGGHLASIHDGFTNAMIAQKAEFYFHESTVTDCYIGLTSLISFGNWSWTDGTPYDFESWSNGQNLTGSNCASLFLNDGSWRVNDCYLPKPYVCTVDKSNFETTTLPTTPILSYVNCTRGMTYFPLTHSCYGRINYTDVLNWTTAEQYCLQLGGHLPSIHSYEELEFLISYVYYAWYDSWTGLYSNDGGNTWKWSDGSDFDYNPWYLGKPDKQISGYGELEIDGVHVADSNRVLKFICKVVLLV